MRYHFDDIPNGQICEGYTVIEIKEHEAEITDEAAILLAEKHGGQLVTQQGKPPKDPGQYRAKVMAELKEENPEGKEG